MVQPTMHAAHTTFDVVVVGSEQYILRGRATGRWDIFLLQAGGNVNKRVSNTHSDRNGKMWGSRGVGCCFDLEVDIFTGGLIVKIASSDKSVKV